MQRQKDKPTIQGEIECALKKLCGLDIRINYAGRTDAQVHAIGQVIDFTLPNFFDTAALKRALNALINPHIRVIKASIANDNFHARYSCIFRDYMYIIDTADVCMPFFRNYVWHVPRLNVSKLAEIKDTFVGWKNFGAFSKSSSSYGNLQRFIKYIRIKQKGHFIFVFTRGNAFLRGMVRFIVGAMVAYAQGKLNKNEIECALDGKTMHLATIKAPACGLYFKRAIY